MSDNQVWEYKVLLDPAKPGGDGWIPVHYFDELGTGRRAALGGRRRNGGVLTSALKDSGAS